MAQDKKFKLSQGEITVRGPGERGRITLKAFDRLILLTPNQSRRLGNELIRRSGL